MGQRPMQLNKKNPLKQLLSEGYKVSLPLDLNLQALKTVLYIVLINKIL